MKLWRALPVYPRLEWQPHPSRNFERCSGRGGAKPKRPIRSITLTRASASPLSIICAATEVQWFIVINGTHRESGLCMLALASFHCWGAVQEPRGGCVSIGAADAQTETAAHEYICRIRVASRTKSCFDGICSLPRRTGTRSNPLRVNSKRL